MALQLIAGLLSGLASYLAFKYLISPAIARRAQTDPTIEPRASWVLTAVFSIGLATMLISSIILERWFLAAGVGIIALGLVVDQIRDRFFSND